MGFLNMQTLQVQMCDCRFIIKLQVLTNQSLWENNRVWGLKLSDALCPNKLLKVFVFVK